MAEASHTDESPAGDSSDQRLTAATHAAGHQTGPGQRWKMVIPNVLSVAVVLDIDNGGGGRNNHRRFLEMVAVSVKNSMVFDGVLRVLAAISWG